MAVFLLTKSIPHTCGGEPSCLIFVIPLHLSTSTIQKVLIRNEVAPLVKPKRKKKPKRYQMDIPGERVQMDTCKIVPGMYQFTAVDDCTRYLVAEIYPRRTAANTLLFLESCLRKCIFPFKGSRQIEERNSSRTKCKNDYLTGESSFALTLQGLPI